MRIAMSVCVYYSFDRLFPNIEGVTHRNENCNVCMCILFLWSPISKHRRGVHTEMRIAIVCMCILLPWSHISPTWRGLLTEMRIAMSVCVIIPLITYFPDMEGVAHRNENCNVWMGILFPWSPTFPTWRELLIEMRIAMSVYVYFSFDHHFHQHGESCS